MATLGINSWCVLVEKDGQQFAQKINRRYIRYANVYGDSARAKIFADTFILCEVEGETIPVFVNRKSSYSGYDATALDGPCTVDLFGGLYSLFQYLPDAPKYIQSFTSAINPSKTPNFRSCYINTIRQDSGKYKKDQFIKTAQVSAQVIQTSSTAYDYGFYLIDDQGYGYSAGNVSGIGRATVAPTRTNLANLSLKKIFGNTKLTSISNNFYACWAIDESGSAWIWDRRYSQQPKKVQAPGRCVSFSAYDINSFLFVNDSGEMWTGDVDNPEKIQSGVSWRFVDYYTLDTNYVAALGITADNALFSITLKPFTSPLEIDIENIGGGNSFLKAYYVLGNIIALTDDNRVLCSFDVNSAVGPGNFALSEITNEDGSIFYADDVGVWDWATDFGFGCVFFAKGLDGVLYSWGPGLTGFGFEAFDWINGYGTAQGKSQHPRRTASRLCPNSLYKIVSLCCYMIES